MKYLGSAFDVSSVKVTNLANGTASTDAINLQQLNNRVNGTGWREKVRVVAVANVTISSGLENGDSIDGVTLATGDRVLLTAQSTASQNGIYVVVASGTASRATDLATGSSAADAAVFVSEGTSYQNTQWRCTADIGSDVVGTDSLAFSQFAAGTNYSADGTTLSLSGTTFSVANGGVGTTQLADNAVTTAKITDANVTAAKLASDSVTTAKILDSNVTTAKIADANVTAAKLASDSVTTDKILDSNVTTAKINDAAVTTDKINDSAVTTAKIQNSAITTAKLDAASVTEEKIATSAVGTAAIQDSAVTAAKLGTNSVTTGAIEDGAVTDAKLNTKPNKTYTTTIGNGSLTDIPVTHNLGTKAVAVHVYDSSTFADVLVDIVRTSTSVVTLTFASAPSSGAYTVVVQGRAD